MEEGGETTFPGGKWLDKQAQLQPPYSQCGQKGVAVKPRKGDALLFFSLHVNGAVLRPTQRAGAGACSGGTGRRQLAGRCPSPCPTWKMRRWMRPADRPVWWSHRLWSSSVWAALPRRLQTVPRSVPPPQALLGALPPGLLQARRRMPTRCMPAARWSEAPSSLPPAGCVAAACATVPRWGAPSEGLLAAY